MNHRARAAHDYENYAMNDKKKTGVLTFHDYDNYGAILQSYALQKKLLALGVDAELIDYSCRYIKNPFRPVNLRKKGFLNYLYGAIGHICYLPRRRRCRRFRNYMNYSDPVKKEELPQLAEKYDILIAGSDQLWDWSLTDFDQTYFLDFAPEHVKKLSYAVSIGEHLPPEEYRERYAELLGRFDTILMREEYGADFVEALTGSRPLCACDPTLLLTGEEWSRIAGKPRARGKYILAYQLGIDPKLVAFVKKLSAVTGLPVHYVPFPLVGVMKCRMHIACGPDDWAALIRDAEYVVSDSFHGIVFAILFHRKFFTTASGHHKNKRVEEFLRQVGLAERILDREDRSEDAEPNPDLQAEIDFTACDEQIEIMRKMSLERLADALAVKP